MSATRNIRQSELLWNHANYAQLLITQKKRTTQNGRDYVGEPVAEPADSCLGTSQECT